ncbi:hypothetical protein T261_3380 [Streptomyces lydicus]|nr:hypothetical protein T261_3380 [Streptomyces lydicus]
MRHTGDLAVRDDPARTVRESLVRGRPPVTGKGEARERTSHRPSDQV